MSLPALVSAKSNLNLVTPAKLSKKATKSSISAFGLVLNDTDISCFNHVDYEVVN